MTKSSRPKNAPPSDTPNRRPLVSLPIGDYPHTELALKDWEAQHPEVGFVAYGYCATFCQTDVPPLGATVDQHGLWCESRLYGEADGNLEDGTRFEMFSSVVAPYLHGQYAAPARRGLKDPMVCIAYYDADHIHVDAQRAYLTIGEVRRFAAALIYTCDVADQIGATADENSAAAQRHEEYRAGGAA
jgi:hypothetical protein